MFQKDTNRKLGKAPKRRYDLPFQKDIGTRYMMIVVAMMVFLSILAMSLHMTMSALSTHWTTGLEGHITIEIPPNALDQTMRHHDELTAIAERMIATLSTDSVFKSLARIPENELAEMVAPWLGFEMNNTDQDIPFPVLIAAQTHEPLSENDIALLKDQIIGMDASSRLDTHQNWLSELLKFTSILKVLSIILGLVISITTFVAVAGVVNARLVAHVSDVELLHLMGATDDYIAGQFKRHVLILAFIGCIIGCTFGAGLIWLIAQLIGRLDLSLMPEFSFHIFHWGMLCLVPFMILLLCYITADRTLHKALSKMP
jgi:cell division transport system permease protein